MCAKYYITFRELARPDLENTHSQCNMSQDIACLRLDPVISSQWNESQWTTSRKLRKMEIPLPVLRQAPHVTLTSLISLPCLSARVVCTPGSYLNNNRLKRS